MEEPKRILTLFENLYNGDPWLDVTLMGTLENITAEKAAEKKIADRNSIWEITNHIIEWRKNVLQRVHGKTLKTPQHNYFLPVEDTSAAAWKNTIEKLRASEKEWEAFLNQMKSSDLETVHPMNGHTHYEHIHGIIQHDAYHLGQIVMLVKHP